MFNNTLRPAIRNPVRTTISACVLATLATFAMSGGAIAQNTAAVSANAPKGTVRLMVTSERHESFGKDIEIEKDSQEIDVKLKKPQPLL